MALYLGSVAPNFDAETSQGKINFHEWIGDSWAIFFSHPADFTPVCTTELGEVALKAEEWLKRGVKPIAISVDSSESHVKWIPDIEEVMQTKVDYPIIADPDRSIATLYNMIAPGAGEGLAGQLTARSVFIIDKNKKIRLFLTYPASTGRNFHELLRVIDSLQLTDAKKAATPVNWNVGDKVVVPKSVNDEELAANFTDVEVKTPYLRFAALKQ